MLIDKIYMENETSQISAFWDEMWRNIKGAKQDNASYLKYFSGYISLKIYINLMT